MVSEYPGEVAGGVGMQSGQSENSKQLLRRLRESWNQSTGHPPPPGASEEQVREFEVRYQVKLPLDLREYLQQMNGSGGMDGWMIDFWPIQRIEPSSGTKLAGKWFDFADYSINASIYAIRLSNNLDDPNPIISAYGEGESMLAENFTEFVRRYLEDARSIL